MLQLRDSAIEIIERMAGIPEGVRLFSTMAKALSRDIDSWTQWREERQFEQ
jgi:hypothetical protein